MFEVFTHYFLQNQNKDNKSKAIQNTADKTADSNPFTLFHTISVFQIQEGIKNNMV